MMGRITTHVLDTSRGQPGRGVALRLYRLDKAGQRTQVCASRTNHDGRCDQPLCEGSDLTAGYYELDFEIGDYFRSHATDDSQAAEIAFLGRVTLRFGVADPAAHYHVPLVVTPWSYSTYRGS